MAIFNSYVKLPEGKIRTSMEHGGTSGILSPEMTLGPLGKSMGTKF